MVSTVPITCEVPAGVPDHLVPILAQTCAKMEIKVITDHVAVGQPGTGRNVCKVRYVNSKSYNYKG